MGRTSGCCIRCEKFLDFLAVGVIAIIIFLREQVLGLLSLVLLGVATAVTAWFPQMAGF